MLERFYNIPEMSNIPSHEEYLDKKLKELMLIKNKLKYPIIGICGLKNSGKEEFSKMLQTAYLNKLYDNNYHYGNEYHIVEKYLKGKLEVKHFATPLKQVASILLSVDIDVFNNRKTKEQYRHHLLELSNVLKKDDDERFRRVTRAEIANNPRTTFILEDLRLKPEETLIRELNGYIIGIERPDNQNNINHETETNYVNIQKDIIINNDGTLDDLYQKAVEVINNLFVK
jgi:hypothetical protein